MGRQIIAIPACGTDLFGHEEDRAGILPGVPSEFRPSKIGECLQRDVYRVVALDDINVCGVDQITCFVDEQLVLADGYTAQDALSGRARIPRDFLAAGCGLHGAGDELRLGCDLFHGRETDVSVGLQFPFGILHRYAQRRGVDVADLERDVAVAFLSDVVYFCADG